MKNGVVCFLPVKGKSNRIKSKNKRLLNGKPLFLYTLEKLIECKLKGIITHIVLDTECEDIIRIANRYKGEFHIMRRDIKFANNDTDGNQLFANECDFYNDKKYREADIYIQILCTSPFIKVNTIEKAIKELSNSEDKDSLFFVKGYKNYTWTNNKPNYNLDNIPNSVDLEETIEETMNCYMVKKESINLRKRIGNKPILYKIDSEESIDINYEEDFKLANKIAKGNNYEEILYFNSIKNTITTPMLSDIMDDMGISNKVIQGLKSNNGVPIMGKARTLKLRKLLPNEDYKGIYKALESYDSMSGGDIILIENEEPNLAYYGDLNATISIRKGVEGVIVGGNTRDYDKVKSINMNVYSNGYNCKDVRKRCTVESINEEIEINNVTIYYDDVIFADNDGVVVIPKFKFEEIIEKALQTSSNENEIVNKITKGESLEKILKENGEF